MNLRASMALCGFPSLFAIGCSRSFAPVSIAAEGGAEPPEAVNAKSSEGEMLLGIDPLVALGVVVATAATDAVYVMFTSAVVARRRVPAATWSSVWYLLSSFAVISYTSNWMYVAFAAAGSWIGAYLTMTYIHGPPGRPPAPLNPSPM